MKNAKENKKSPSSAFSGIWGTVLMMFLITVAFGILIYGMYITDFISIIDFSSFIASNREEGNLVNNDPVYDTLMSGAKEYEFVYASTPEELTDIIAGFALPEKYSFKATAVTVGSVGLDNVKLSASRDKDTYVIEKSREGTMFEKIELGSDGYVTVTDVERNRSAKHKSSENITFEGQCGIPSLTDVSDICYSILNNTTDASEYSVALVSREGSSYYCVSVYFDDIKQLDEYYLSTDTCLIEEAYTYIDGTLIYRYHLDEYSA